MEDTYHLPPMTETRIIIVDGQSFEINVRNTDNENGLTGLYVRCTAWRALHIICLGPYTTMDEAFAAAEYWTARRLADPHAA